jgi:hypothetical protein
MMVETAVVIVAAVILSLGAWLTYSHTPILSRPFRVKIVSSYEGVEVSIVKRFKVGIYSSDRATVATIQPTASDFDERMAQAVSDAQQRVAVLRASQGMTKRIR